MSGWRYTFLLSSLPLLPWFERARALPIGEPRLRTRLVLLSPADGAALSDAEALIAWRRQQQDVPDAVVLARMRGAAARHPRAVVRELVAFRLDSRIVVAALRARRAGALSLPEALRGGGPLADSIARRWTEPDFGLGVRCPWITELRHAVEAGDWLAAERCLLARAWRHLVSIEQRHSYAFENVVGYVFRWDILARWLAMDRARAAARIDSLLAEALVQAEAVRAE